MTLYKRKLGILFALVLLLVISSIAWLKSARAGSADNNTPQVMMILDASRSMWGRVDGRPKVSIAREVIQKLMGEWNPDVALGLMAYGHRRSGDCEDIEVLVPVNLGTAERVNKLVQGIIPEGRTPLSQSLIEAAEALKYRTEKANLILVTDGLETCGKNPCEVARKLKKEGINFTAHVIGYDLNDAESSQLSCIAKSTGGLHLKASSAEQLKDAFDKVIKEVEAPKRLANDTAIATMVAGSAPISSPDLYWKLTDINDHSKIISQSRGSIAKLDAPAGNYRLFGEIGELKANMPIIIDQSKVQQHQLVMNAGELITRALVSSGDGRISWEIYRNGSRVGSGVGKKSKTILAPGSYTVRGRYQKADMKQEIKLSAGQRVELGFDFRDGSLGLQALKGKGLAAMKAHWKAFKVNPDGSRGEIVGNQQNVLSPQLTLPAGSYIIEATHPEFGITAQKGVYLAPNKTLNETLIFPTGNVTASAAETAGGPPVKVSWLVYEVDINGKRGRLVSRQHTANPNFTLPTGQYMVVAKLGDAEVSQLATVREGETSRLGEFVLNGSLTVSAIERAGAEENAVSSHWRIYKEQNGRRGDVVMSARNTDRKTFKLNAGKYRVVAEHAALGIKQSIKIHLRTGDKLNKLFVYPTGSVALVARESANGPAKEVDWLVYEILPNGKIGKLVSRKRSKHPKFSLPEGKYRVIARDGDAEVSKDITIKKGKAINATFLLTGELVVLARESKNGKPAFVDWKIFQVFKSGQVGEQIVESNRSKRKFQLPAGHYRVIAIDDEYGEFKRDIVIKAGKSTRKVFSFDLGTVTVRAYDVEGGTEQFVKWEIFQLNKDGSLGEQVIESNRSEREFKLPAGKYKAIARDGDAVLEHMVTVTAGKNVEQPFYLGGTLNVSAWQMRDGKQVSVQWLVYRMDKGDEPSEIAVTGIRAARSFVLPAGRYRVVGRHDAMDREADVELKPGQVVNKKFFLNLGTLSMCAYRKGDDVPVAVKWHVYRLDDHGMSVKEVTTSIRAERDVILPAGKYRVLARHDKQSFSQVVEVHAGETFLQKFIFPSDTNRNSKLKTLKPLKKASPK